MAMERGVVVRFFVLVGLYVAATWFAEAFIKGPGQVTIFWPAAGVAYAAVIRYGWRWSLFIPPAVIIAHAALVPVPDSFLPFSVASNLLGALAGYFALGRGVRPDIRVDSGFALLQGAVVMVVVAAGIGTVGLLSSGMVPGEAALAALVRWAMGDLVGILCVTPTMLLLTAPAWSHPDEPPAREFSKSYEIAAWAAGLVVSYVVVYFGGRHDSFYALGMVALPLTALLWSAFRFRPIWTAVGTGLSVAFLTSMTGLGLAGFRPPVETADAMLLLGFMLLFGIVPLAVAALVNQQRRMNRRMLRQAVHDAEAQRVALEEVVAQRTRELNEANARLERASQTDPLTGLRNRRYLTNQIPADLAFYDREHARTGQEDALLFALLDIDHFKRINDTHGHAVGDKVLQQVSDVLTRLVRSGDYVVRWGGEEFLLVFRPVARESVPLLGERLRAAVEGHAYDIGDGTVLPVTCSIGLAEYPMFRGGQQGLGWEEMLELADAALYWVKANGRNGWAALRPTAETDIQNLMTQLREGAEAMVENGQLSLISSHYACEPDPGGGSRP